MNRDEVFWRIRSLLSAQLDIVRAPLDLYPELKSEFIRPIGSTPAGFNCSPRLDRLEIGSHDEYRTEWKKPLLDKANLILNDRLSFFDLDNQHVGDPIQWFADFSSGKTGPIRHCTLTDYRDFDLNGDCKLVWEPNRHHQMVILARAYVISGDIKFANKVVDLMLDWIDSNPFGYGMNWKSPLEVGIRLINWVWAIHLVRASGALDDKSWAKILRMLYRATWDTQRKFSQGSSANNHLIGEAAGVFVACTYFPFFPDSNLWLDRSKSILEREIMAQSYADGCTREHAFGYQFFVLQFLTLSMIAGDRSQNSFSDAYRNRLHEMYRFLADICADTGRQPNLGDADDGYVLDLGDLPKDSFELISIAAQMFDDPSLLLVESSETAYWLLPETSQNKSRMPQELASHFYAKSGYAILRAKVNNVAISAFFDCAPLGYGSIAAHGHADCLSVLLNVAGEELLVDAGTYDYFSHPDWRLHFRKTEAHNTLTVDGHCQSVSTGPFMWGNRANEKLIDWEDSDTVVKICGEHDGYKLLADPVSHRRTVTLNKLSGQLIIDDKLSAKSEHTYRRYFHLSPECEAFRIDAHRIRIVRGDTEVLLETDADESTIVHANDDQKLGWISRGYHRREKSTTLIFNNTVVGDAAFQTQIRVLDSESV